MKVYYRHYLYYTSDQSIQKHILRHISRSCDCRYCFLYNCLHTVDCNFHHTIRQYILFKIIKVTIQCIYLYITTETKKMIHDLSRYLTFNTIHSSPSRFTTKANSKLYVTHIVFTVGGTRAVTFISIDARFLTP